MMRKLLKGIETGDPEAAAVVAEDRYVQHNPQTGDNADGLAALFARISKTNPRVNVVRAFEDDSHKNGIVFGMTEYFFDKARVGFEVFRFDEDDKAVEHWDNIQPRQGEGRSMVEGPTQATDLEKTEENRAKVTQFVSSVLIPQKLDAMSDYVAEDLVQRAPYLENGKNALLNYWKSGTVEYNTLHKVFAQGNFVLSICEGLRDGAPTSFYDLYRIEGGMLVEHWDTIEEIPSPDTWKNANGKLNFSSLSS